MTVTLDWGRSVIDSKGSDYCNMKTENHLRQ